MLSLRKTVFVSGKVLRKIEYSIWKTGNSYEMGGVLLGYRLFFAFIVVDATVPDKRARKSVFSFELDGPLTQKAVEKLMKGYWKKPEVIGVWHSHIGGLDTFSRQDRKSNQIMAEQFGGILSILAIPNQENGLERLAIYHIMRNGREKRCRTLHVPDSAFSTIFAHDFLREKVRF